MELFIFLGAFGKVQGGLPATSNSYPVGELAFSGLGQFSGSESQKHGLSKGAVTSPDGLSTTLSAGKVLEHDVGSSNTLADANKTAQVVFFSFSFHAPSFKMASVMRITVPFLGLL